MAGVARPQRSCAARGSPRRLPAVSKSLKNISIVAFATVISRVLGLVREIVVAAYFGTAALNSAFVSAFTLPNLFRRLLGEGALTAAFVPTMSDELESRQRDGAFALLSKVSTRLAVVTTAIVALGMLTFANAETALALLQRAGMSEDTGRRLLLGADLAVILFPYMVFVCLAAAFSAACQILGRFTEPALSPIWLNLAIIGALLLGGALALAPLAHMHLLCAGVLLGGFLQMIVPAGVLVRLGWRPRFDLRGDEKVGEIARLMGPMVIGSAIYLINIVVQRLVGLSLNDNAASVLNLSNRVMELPIGVFAAAIATVVFPLIARHAARGDMVALGADYQKGMRLVLLLNVPAAIGLALLSEPITRVLFQRGAFHASDTALMTPILAIYAAGLPFLSFTSLALRGFYALKDTGTPVRAAVLSFITNLVLSVVAVRVDSTAMLAAATNIAVVVQAVYLQINLSKKGAALGFAPLLGSVVKIVVASVIMGACVWAGARGLDAVIAAGKGRDLVQLIALIPAACAVYAALLWALKIEGREDVRELVVRRLRRTRGGGDEG
ncbi:MAG: murein biosynthesis integral membrane protein MurJ [Opitutaceae bacterium]|nr:murein biosynthesis integral membrane protein MurJ [Opitutaceae bacterium]